MTDGRSRNSIITVSNLKSYFFDGLNELNNKSICPVPQEIIYYSSDVLNKFSVSQEFFDVNDGRVRQKILGIKMLEALHLSKDEQKKVYKEVADTALFVCGYFSESVNRKILDTSYYYNLGRSAYGQLNSVVPKYLDVPCFYSMLATSFGPLTGLISKLASKDRFENENYILNLKALHNDLSDEELYRNNIHPALTKKIS